MMKPLFMKFAFFKILIIALLGGLLSVSLAMALEPASDTNTPAWKGSGALFVGVGKFDADSGLGALCYTTDDAVALAKLFVQDFKLVPADHVWLALSGEPTSANMKQALEKLKLLGIKQVPADRKTLLQVIKDAANAASDPNGLLLMSFNTHGFEEGGKDYLMPSDGQAADFETTGLPLNSIKNAVQKAAANKRLLFVDACRQEKTSSSRGDDQMPEAFYKALLGSSGYGVFVSCKGGQKSWEDEKFEHGVYTHFLIEAMQGKAGTDGVDGFIHLRQIAHYAEVQTKEWVWREKSSEQTPWFEGEPVILDIPLAMDPEQRGRIKLLRTRADASLQSLSEAKRNYPAIMSSEVYSAVVNRLDIGTGPELEKLVAKIEEVAAHKSDQSYLEDFTAWFKGRYTKATDAPAASPVAYQNNASPTKAANGAGGKPSIYIQFDPVGQNVTQVWTASAAAQFRDMLAQALRNQGGFLVRSEQSGKSSSASNASEPDYVLTVRIDNFEHLLDQTDNQKGFGMLTLGLMDSYTPKSQLSVGYGIKRVIENSELKTDQVALSEVGKTFKHANIQKQGQNRASEDELKKSVQWPDAPLMLKIANQIALALNEYCQHH